MRRNTKEHRLIGIPRNTNEYKGMRKDARNGIEMTAKEYLETKII